MAYPAPDPMSPLHEVQLSALVQGLEAVPLPVALIDVNLVIVHANKAFQSAYHTEAAAAVVGDACARLGLAQTQEGGAVIIKAPWSGEGSVSGSRRVRLRPIFLEHAEAPAVIALAIERRAARRLTSENLQHRFGLSPRQAEVALMLAQGQTTAEIARTLNLTTHTVRHHAEQVLRRLNVRTRQQALVRLRDGTARGPKARPSGGHARPF